MSTVDMQKFNGPKEIICNKCDKMIKKIVAKTEKLTDNRIGYYFCCDNCGEKYKFAAISEKGQKLLPKIQKLKHDIRKFPSLHKNLHFSLQKTLVDYNKEVDNTYNEEDVL